LNRNFISIKLCECFIDDFIPTSFHQLSFWMCTATSQYPSTILNEDITKCLNTYCNTNLYVSTTVLITVGYMFRLINSHLQTYSLQVKSQDAVHTLGSQCVYISEILKPYHLQMMWLKYFTDINTLGSQCVHSIL